MAKIIDIVHFSCCHNKVKLGDNHKILNYIAYLKRINSGYDEWEISRM